MCYRRDDPNRLTQSKEQSVEKQPGHANNIRKTNPEMDQHTPLFVSVLYKRFSRTPPPAPSSSMAVHEPRRLKDISGATGDSHDEHLEKQALSSETKHELPRFRSEITFSTN